MEVDAYLKRIKSEDYKEVSLENLRKLHANHLLNVPFENFGYSLNEYIKIDLESIFNKIVLSKRGGICCELNQLFAWLLKELGYNLQLISCMFLPMTSPIFYPWNAHLALIVHLDNKSYLVDVGITMGFRHPLEFVTNKIQQDKAGHFLIEKDVESNDLNNIFSLLRTSKDLNSSEVNWRIHYKFNIDSKRIDDFQEMLDWVQSSDCPRMFNRSLCLKHTENSIKKLIVDILTEIIFKDGIEIDQKETKISEEALIDTIEKEFSIKISKEFKPRNIPL